MSAGIHEKMAGTNGTRTRRRNGALALALALFSSSLMFIFGPDGHMVWWMWRDAPLVSTLLALAGVYFAVRWWRTPRS